MLWLIRTIGRPRRFTSRISSSTRRDSFTPRAAVGSSRITTRDPKAAARATAQIKKREAELVDEFKKKGLGVNPVNRQSFVDAVLKAKPVASLGYDPKDYERIAGIK